MGAPDRLTRRLCRLEDFAENTSQGFAPSSGGFTGLFAIRTPDAIHVYVNACPHIGVALDWSPNDFLTRDGANIVCATHGALFDISSGVCIQGPCRGDHLEPVASTIEDGWLLVADDAGL